MKWTVKTMCVHVLTKEMQQLVTDRSNVSDNRTPSPTINHASVVQQMKLIMLMISNDCKQVIRAEFDSDLI